MYIPSLGFTFFLLLLMIHGANVALVLVLVVHKPVNRASITYTW
jgi:hypothetical protein